MSAFSLAVRAVKEPLHWLQLGKFSLVGASGYVVNLSVYIGLLSMGAGYLTAAVGSFSVAVCNNYLLNRRWTFKAKGAHVRQGPRYLVISLAGLGLNVALLALLVNLGLGALPAQATAIALVTPLSFFGNKRWSFA